jgi:hypothetical protein
MNVDTPDKPSKSVAEKLLLVDLYSCVSVYSRAVVLKRFKKHGNTPVKLINITNDAIKQHPNKNIDVSNVKVNGEMLSVKCCLDLILKAMSTIQAIYNLASHGNMSEIPQQRLANAIRLLINLRAGLLEPPLSPLANWLQQLKLRK